MFRLGRSRFTSLAIIALLVALLAVMTVGVSSCGTKSDPSFSKDVQEKLDKVLADTMSEYGVPGAIVGIWVPGKGSYVVARGKADLKTGRAANSTDKFRLACITKTFTSTVILQLVDEGKIKLDDTLSKFDLGVNVPGADKITVRQLLNHTSGLFNFTDDPNFWIAVMSNPLKPWTSKELVEIAISHPPNFQPGQDYKYNNTDFELLKMIIMKVTGNSAEDEITKRIIDPLGLKNTSYPKADDPKVPNPHLNGYMPPDWGAQRGTTNLNDLVDVTEYDPFAEGMISNLSDLKIWAKDFAEGKLLSPNMQKERLKDLVPPNNPQAGLGFLYAAGFIGRSGELPGYNPAMYYEPKSGITIVAAVNRYPSKDEGVVDIIWINLMKTLKEANVLPSNILASPETGK